MAQVTKETMIGELLNINLDADELVKTLNEKLAEVSAE